MSRWNHVYLEGRLGRDPELKQVGGYSKAVFTIAVYTGKDKPPLWVPIVCWGSIADLAHNVYKKGQKVAVTGRLSKSEWNGKEYWEVVADSIETDGNKADEYRQKAEKIFDGDDDFIPEEA